jgi:hypothetical protein
VIDNDTADGENIEEGVRQANSNLERLIEAIGGLLAASSELLARLQEILSGARPAAGSTAPDEFGAPPADCSDC